MTSLSAKLNKSVYALAICQALLMSCTSLMATISVLVGQSLALNDSYATVPVSMQFVGIMLMTIPASLLMARYGRKLIFLIAGLSGVFAAGLALMAILTHTFSLYVVAAVFIGMIIAVGNYFRFAVTDLVSDDLRSRAISLVMAGGIAAAFVGPNIASYTQGWFSNESYAGSFVVLMLIFACMVGILAMLRFPVPAILETTEQTQARPLRVIVKQPRFIVAVVCAALGYVFMVFLMTITPLAMQHHAHDLDDTVFVIQWHVLAMFAPSFVTGTLIERYGMGKILLCGVLLGFVAIVINLLDQTLGHFWTALFVLGVSWNFLFIGGTRLLTDTYRESEKAKVQALNDFLVYGSVMFATFIAGYVNQSYGWAWVNLSMLPLLIIMLMSLIWWRYQAPISLPSAQ